MVGREETGCGGALWLRELVYQQGKRQWVRGERKENNKKRGTWWRGLGAVGGGALREFITMMVYLALMRLSSGPFVS